MELTEEMRRQFAINRFAGNTAISANSTLALSTESFVNLLAKFSWAPKYEIADYLNAEAYIIPSKGLVK
jgi:hypothetical protein